MMPTPDPLLTRRFTFMEVALVLAVGLELALGAEWSGRFVLTVIVAVMFANLLADGWR